MPRCAVRDRPDGQLAGIEPEFTTYDGDDPDGYALAVNIARRHLSKGQQAMVVVLADSLLSKERGAKQRAAKSVDVSAARISQAVAVLKYATDLAAAVVTGSEFLNKAYEIAKDRKRAAESTEAQMAALRGEAPDLADQVTEERLSLPEAHLSKGQQAMVAAVLLFLPDLVITSLVVNSSN